MERVRILHVSDVHCDVARMRAVAAQAAQGRHDCIIVTGDLARYDHERHRGREMEAEADAHQVLLAVEEGHALPVYFLPGNHDAPALLAVPPVDARGRRAVNVHGCAAVPLAPGLSVCGLGGAVPAAQGGYIVWDGFPYTEQQVLGRPWRCVCHYMLTSVAQMGVQLHALWETQLARAPDDQVLLLMHCGPYDAGTTVCFKDVTRDPIQSGSTNLRFGFCARLPEGTDARALLAGAWFVSRTYSNVLWPCCTATPTTRLAWRKWAQ